jgi:hypothetical protein
MIFPAALILRLSNDAINILTRQAFIMMYGSFETYLFQIFERSFPMIGIKDEILDRSITVLISGPLADAHSGSARPLIAGC